MRSETDGAPTGPAAPPAPQTTPFEEAKSEMYIKEYPESPAAFD